MKKNFINFISVALVITGLLVTADGLLKKNWDRYNLEAGLPILLVFLLLYSLLHWRLLSGAEKQPKRFVNTFMGLFGLKMLVLLGFLGIFVYTHPEQKIAFLLLFASAYVLHTLNEVFWASRFVKNPA